MNKTQRLWLYMGLVATVISVVFAPFHEVKAGKGGNTGGFVVVVSVLEHYRWMPAWATTLPNGATDVAFQERENGIWIAQIAATGTTFGLLVFFPPTRPNRRELSPKAIGPVAGAA